MMYTLHYDSPLGGILLAADDVGLTGLWFDGEPYFAEGLDPEHTAQKTPILQQAERWLEVYFSGREPGFTPPLHPIGSPFRQACPAQDPLPVLWAYLPAAARLRR